MKKRLSMLLCFLLVAVCVILPVTANAANSGSVDAAQPTKVQIAAKYNEIVKIGEVFDERPSTSAPYTLGKLSDSAKLGTITYLNYIRYVAKLPALELREDLNTSAQHGAVVNAANGVMSHTPDQPANMSYDFYKEGYAATSSSNLSCSWGYTEAQALIVGVQGCMDDEDPSNADVIGHRRWFLNPTLKYVGVGSAVSQKDDWQYSAYKVFDKSGSCSYDYVSWPASGNMPTNLFGHNVPWSVTLNPAIYNVPNRNALQITVTGGGNKWVFNGSTPGKSNGSAPYLRVDSSGYGVPNCLIFRPDYSKLGGYSGVYTVKITGLTKRDGTSATIEYQVDFFDVEEYKSLINISRQPGSQKVYPGESVTVSVDAKGDGLTYQWYYRSGKNATKLSGATGNTYTSKVDKSHNGGQLYCVITDQYGNTATTEAATITIKNAVKITAQPASVSVQEGKSFSVTVGATGDGLTYQWYYKDKGMTAFQKDAAQTGATYALKATTAIKDRQLICRVTDEYGNLLDTNAVTISVKAILKLTGHPSTAKVKNGKTVTLSASATGDGLKYQWYYKDKGGKSYQAIKGATSATYKVKMSKSVNGRTYYCKVTDQYGSAASTNEATLTLAATLKITKQPKSAKVYSGTKLKVTVKATGDGLSYKWYYKDKGAKSYKLDKSVTGSTYNRSATKAMNGRKVYCKITDEYGNTVKTKTVTLTVKAKAKIKTQPKSAKVVLNDTAKFTVKASGDGLKYQWYYKDKTMKSYKAIKSAKKSTYKIKLTKKNLGRKLYCKITDKYGNVVKTKTVTLQKKTKGITATFTPSLSKETMDGRLYNTCMLTVKPAKGTAPYQYKYEVFRDKDSKYPQISRGYTSSRSYGIMSTGSLKNLVARITIKDSKGYSSQYRINMATGKVLSYKVIK